MALRCDPEWKERQKKDPNWFRKDVERHGGRVIDPPPGGWRPTPPTAEAAPRDPDEPRVAYDPADAALDAADRRIAESTDPALRREIDRRVRDLGGNPSNAAMRRLAAQALTDEITRGR